MFLKATEKDIDAVTRIYDAIHTAEENGDAVIGWIRRVYPVRQTASPMCSLCCRRNLSADRRAPPLFTIH